MRYVALTRRVSLLVFDDLRPDSANYPSACQLTVNGEYGMVDTLVGPGFYKLMASDAWAPFKAQGLRVIYATISAAHLRLMRRAIGHLVDITQIGTNSIDGHAMPWVQISEKSKSV